jgi:MFS family permease
LSSYAVIRFIAGVGLAGELGAGITLIVETMDKEKRGYGTMIIVTFGALGAVFAYLVADIFGDWKISYIVGGAMGLALLALRIGAYESRMYKEIESHSGVRRGDFLSLFTNKVRLRKYLWCIAMGLPVWFVVGILINLTESYFEPYLKLKDDISTGKAVLFCYLGLSVGDFLSGLLSQINKSRLKVVQLYLIVCCLLVLAYVFILPGTQSQYFYALCFLLGGATGYWALFVTVAAEQFGTNIRSTVTSTVPNFVRGAVIPITLGFEMLANIDFLGIIGAVILVGIICMGLAILAAYKLEETFGKDLNYHEM